MKILLIFILLAFSNVVICQPTNDLCNNAIFLVNNADSCNFTVYDNTNATNTDPQNLCQTPSEPEVWFTFVATSTEVNFSFGSVSFSTGSIAAFSMGTTCSTMNTGNLEHCSAFGPNFTRTLNNFVPGEQYIFKIKMDLNVNGVFEMCVWSPSCTTPNAQIILNSQQSCNTSCDGSATASGGDSYLWNNGDTTPTSNNLCGGTNTVIVTNSLGCFDIASINISYEDTISPVAICQDVTIDIDTNSSISINAIDIDGGSTDNCEITWISVFPSSFDCNDIGIHQVALSVADMQNNLHYCIADLTIVKTSINLWQGGAVGNWNDSSGFWSLGRIPTECDNVLIPNGATVNLQAGMNGDGYTLEVENGGSLIVDQTAILTIQIE